MTILFIIMGLAAVFGFSLSAYFFLYRVNGPRPLRWLGAVLGGAVAGALMAVVVLLILWPPFSIILTAGILILAVIASVIILQDRKSRKHSTDSQRITVRGESDDDMDVCSFGLDLDIGAGS